MATKTGRHRTAKRAETSRQPLQDIVQSLSVLLDQVDRRAKRIDIQLGESRVSIEFSDMAPAPDSMKALAVTAALAGGDLQPGDKVPNRAEQDVVGPFKKRIQRTDPEFQTLVSNSNSAIVFKDEEGTGADRMMTGRLKAGLDALAVKVGQEWSGARLRVTEAWDEDGEHSPKSLHYEGRAADITTAPPDGAKLGRLARLAVDAGLDWVFFENSAHVHVSAS
jgi:hypothetical protein